MTVDNHSGILGLEEMSSPETSQSRPLLFLTGGTGFIGKAVLKVLLDSGYRVRALVRKSPESEDSAPEWIRGDLLKPESYSSALNGCRGVIHLGADARFGNGLQYEEINLNATVSLLRLAEETPGMEHFVFVSTIGAVDRAPGDPCEDPLTESSPPNPSSDYGSSKLAAECVVRKSRLATTILRPSLVVGRGMRKDSHVRVFVSMAKLRKLISRFYLPGRFSLVHVDDVASAVLQVLFREAAYGKTFFLSAEAASLGDIWRWTDSGRAQIPVQFIRRFLMKRGFFSRWIRTLLPLKVKSLVLDTLWASSGEMEKLGWRPRFRAKEMVLEVMNEGAGLADGGYTWITGAGSGLGRELSLELARRGRRLVLVDVDRLALRDCALRCRELTQDVEEIPCDLAGEDVELLLRGIGEPRLIPNEMFLIAGVGYRGETTTLPEDLLLRMIRLNFESRVRIARRAALEMGKRGRGTIVLISSSSAFQPLPLMAVYAATNAAVLSFGEALSSEMKGSGIHVLTVCPGGMRTAFQAKAGVKVSQNDKLADPGKIAQAILRSVDSKRTTLIVGPRSHSMSVLARVLPRRAQLALWHKLMVQMR